MRAKSYLKLIRAPFQFFQLLRQIRMVESLRVVNTAATLFHPGKKSGVISAYENNWQLLGLPFFGGIP